MATNKETRRSKQQTNGNNGKKTFRTQSVGKVLSSLPRKAYAKTIAPVMAKFLHEPFDERGWIYEF